MSTLARKTPASSGPSGDSPTTQQVADEIGELLKGMTVKQRDDVLRKVAVKVRPITTPRAGPVLDAVVLAFPTRRNWTVESLAAAVDSQGISATSKEIYNALGYLTRKGHIKRVGYGQYILANTSGVVDIIGPEDGTVRNSEHYS